MSHRRRELEEPWVLLAAPLYCVVLALWIASVVIFTRYGGVGADVSIGAVTGSACRSMNGVLLAYVVILSALVGVACCCCVGRYVSVRAFEDDDSALVRWAYVLPVFTAIVFNVIATVRLAQAGFECRDVPGLEQLYDMNLANNVILSVVLYTSFLCACENWLDYRLIDDDSPAPLPVAQPVIAGPAPAAGAAAAAPAAAPAAAGGAAVPLSQPSMAQPALHQPDVALTVAPALALSPSAPLPASAPPAAGGHADALELSGVVLHTPPIAAVADASAPLVAAASVNAAPPDNISPSLQPVEMSDASRMSAPKVWPLSAESPAVAPLPFGPEPTALPAAAPIGDADVTGGAAGGL